MRERIEAALGRWGIYVSAHPWRVIFGVAARHRTLRDPNSVLLSGDFERGFLSSLLLGNSLPHAIASHLRARGTPTSRYLETDLWR